ncbi:MAG TPA: LuxR C-terminal-related transcriptional regulator, partial [Ktedonobacterales bacterium]|nr:LuxR C-terminal-related transcriptional regulator [Ktedonobacterales bacterium]
ARELANELGALATVASVDIELTAVYLLRFELERSLEAAQRALAASHRYRLMGVQSVASLFLAELHGLRGDRAGMEGLLADLPAVDGEEAAYFETCRNAFRGEASLCENNRKQALRELAAAVTSGRRLSTAAPSPCFGEWTLVWSLENRDSSEAQARAEAPPPWAMIHPINRAMVQYAAAVRLGRRGQAARAAEAAALGDRLVAQAPWYLHMGRRLMADAAIADRWGEPARWLPGCETFFDQHGYQAVASACRSLLRRCGARSTGARTHPGVPEPFARLGVTQREMEVLAVLPDGLSNKEIAARLYLSTKTVEKHVASLMDKLAVRSRAHLAAIATARGGVGHQQYGSPVE